MHLETVPCLSASVSLNGCTVSSQHPGRKWGQVMSEIGLHLVCRYHGSSLRVVVGPCRRPVRSSLLFRHRPTRCRPRSDPALTTARCHVINSLANFVALCAVFRPSLARQNASTRESRKVVASGSSDSARLDCCPRLEDRSDARIFGLSTAQRERLTCLPAKNHAPLSNQRADCLHPIASSLFCVGPWEA